MYINIEPPILDQINLKASQNLSHLQPGYENYGELPRKGTVVHIDKPLIVEPFQGDKIYICSHEIIPC